MKQLMITVALVVSLTSLGFSQDKTEKTRKEDPRTERPGGEQQRQARTPEQRAQMATDALEKKLSLTADQKAKVYALNLERAEKMEKSMKTEREFRKDQMENQKSLMEESEKKLNRILTNEQQKTHNEMKKQSQERMKERRMHGSRHRMQ